MIHVPGTFISNNFEISYGLGALTIDPAGLAITAEDKSKTYGAADPSLTYTESGLFPDDSITGELIREAGEDAGAYHILQGSVTAGDNYALTYDTATLTIDPAALSIGVTAEDKVYDGNREAEVSLSDNRLSEDSLILSYTSALFANKHVGSGKEVSVLGIAVAGSDAGNYLANTEATDTASISSKDLLIGISAEDKIYNGNDSAKTHAFVLSGLVENDDVTALSGDGFFSTKDVGDGLLVTAKVWPSGTDAGNYKADTTATAFANISLKEVTVTPDESFLYIREGDLLPEFAFIYMGWIDGDTGNEGYTVLRDPDGLAYNPASSTSAGTYIVTPIPVNSNYNYAVETGILHVNPYGPGTRAVKPVLNCIEEMTEGYYVANFEYKNENDEAVYITAGADNLLSGSGIDWENSQEVPTMFAPGGGSFRVYFDGSELSWTVNSRDGDQKVANAANANSKSTKCTGNSKKSATVGGEIEEGENLVPDELLAYPNPVVDKVHLTMKDIENYKMIQLYDFAGRSFPITSIDKRTDHLEIDMAQLSAGHYFIRIVMEDSSGLVQIIKK